MTGIRRPGLESRTSQAWLAATVGLICAVLQLSTVSFVTAHDSEAVPLAALLGGMLVVAAGVALALDWERLPRECLLVFPVGALVGFFVEAKAAPHVSPTYTGLIVLVFAYAGLTQRRWISVSLLPLAAVAWSVMQHKGFDGQVRVRLVIAVVLWTVISELLAWKMAESRAQQELLRDRAQQDALTGLDNRHALPTALAARAPQTAVVMIDIDHFKRINDTYGHAEGDRVLQSFAEVLVGVLRGADSAFRYGGEEFLVLAAGAGVAGAERLLLRITTAWREVHPEVTFSAGVSLLDADEPAEAAMARADGALYAAKEAGRDRWVVAGEPVSVLTRIPGQATVIEPDALGLTPLT